MKLKKFSLFVFCLFLLIIVLNGCQKTSETEQPEKVLKEYLDAWLWANTAKMWALLTKEEKEIIPFYKYDQNFEEFPSLRPYQYKIIKTSVFGKTAKIQTELLMPVWMEGNKVEGEKEMVTKNILTFVLKKEGDVWKVSEKETFKK